MEREAFEMWVWGKMKLVKWKTKPGLRSVENIGWRKTIAGNDQEEENKLAEALSKNKLPDEYIVCVEMI